MENLDFVITLAVSLSAAVLFGFLAQKIGLSPIIGYLLAGIAVGPYTPGVFANREVAEALSTVGIILLMFGVGLNFHVKELLSVWKIAVPGAIGQSLAAIGVTSVVLRFSGWDWTSGLVLGIAVSVASTVVLVRVLSDFHELNTPSGRVAVGWLVVEDIFTVIILVLLPALFGKPNVNSSQLPLKVVLTLVEIAALIAIIFFVGGRLLPKLLKSVARSRSGELFTLSILTIALGIAVISAKVFGTSIALGAFLAGMVVGRSEFGLRAASEALPLRDAFAVLFFVSIGMLLNPVYLLHHPLSIGIMLLIILIGKPLAAFLIVVAFRYPVKLALTCAFALAQIGEFSFIMAMTGRELKILPESAVNTIVAASILSISANPLLFRLVKPLNSFIAGSTLLSRIFSTHDQSEIAESKELKEEHEPKRERVIIVGFGAVGKTLTGLLKRKNIDITIIEMNIDTIHKLRSLRIHAIYGDALHRTVLEKAGLLYSISLILSGTMSNGEEIVRTAKSLNPQIKILARATFLKEKEPLIRAGADHVFIGEEELALAMIDYVLKEMGELPGRIESERDKFKAEQEDR